MIDLRQEHVAEIADCTRGPTVYCTAPGCHEATRHAKPYCFDHVLLLPYPARVASAWAARVAAMKHGSFSADLLQEARQLVEEGPVTVRRLARLLDAGNETTQALVEELVASGAKLSHTRRGAAVLTPGEPTRPAKRRRRERAPGKPGPRRRPWVHVTLSEVRAWIDAFRPVRTGKRGRPISGATMLARLLGISRGSIELWFSHGQVPREEVQLEMVKVIRGRASGAA